MPDSRSPRVIVIAHRGASGERPEHTLESYALAIEQGADYIEPDLVMTRDGVLIARHENEIGATTDVAQHPEFAARRRTQVIDGETMTGWFTEDFTLAEIKTLRARERLPALRPANRVFDGRFEVPTFDEILQLVKNVNLRRGGRPRLGVYPETKHPAHFASIGLAQEPAVLRALQRFDYAQQGSPVFIQSFDPNNLRALRDMTHLPLVQLLEDGLGEFKRIGEYADAIGIAKSLATAEARGRRARFADSPFTCGRFAPKTSFCPLISRQGRILRRTAISRRKSLVIWRSASMGSSPISLRSACASATPPRARDDRIAYISAVQPEHQPPTATNFP